MTRGRGWGLFRRMETYGEKMHLSWIWTVLYCKCVYACLLFAKHWIDRFLLLMDFAVVFLTSISIQSGLDFLCSFLIHCNAFSSYTIFITGYWPSQSWSLDWNLTFLNKKKKKKMRKSSPTENVGSHLNQHSMKQLINTDIFPVEMREKEKHSNESKSNRGVITAMIFEGSLKWWNTVGSRAVFVRSENMSI